jgi:hypothetical protein
MLLAWTTTAARAWFNNSGRYLVADQFNNRVIDIDGSGNIIWCPPSVQAIAAPDRSPARMTHSVRTGSP